MTCSQCGRPAIYEVRGHPLCVEHHQMVAQVSLNQMDMLARQSDNIRRRMRVAVGLRDPGPAYAAPQPTIQAMPMTFNNIQVSNSVVGSINTGTIRDLDVALTDVRFRGSPDLADGLTQLTQAVLNANDLNEKRKNEILEHLSVLVTSTTSPTPLPKVVAQSLITALAAR